MKMLRKRRIVSAVLLSLVLTVPVSGADETKPVGSTIEYGTIETDIVTITISKEYMDFREKTYDDSFDYIIGLIQARDDDGILDSLQIREIEDYGITDEGDIYYVLTKEMYQNFRSVWREELVQSIMYETMDSGYYMRVSCNDDLTRILISVAEEDYQAVVSENGRELLYDIRDNVDVYHVIAGTFGDSVTIRVMDIETEEVLDDAKWYE